jgi:hypothetical protein
MHRFITKECRANKGDDKCREEVIEEANATVGQILNGWGQDADIKIHIKVILEKPGKAGAE